MKYYKVLLILWVLSLSSWLAAEDLPPFKIKYGSYAMTSDGKVLGYFGEENRVEIYGLNEVSHWVVDALIATEDRDFYKHDGVSYKGISRAILKTMTGSKQGGSTLTMQLAKNLFLTNERTVSRKVTELGLARQLEAKYTKNELLLLYLNLMYFGNSAHGIWAASHEYFSKPPSQLSATEASLIIGLLKAPTGYNPLKFAQKALDRRNEVLHNLVETGKLAQADFEKMRAQSLNLNPRKNMGGFFLEHVRKEAAKIVARYNKNLTNEVYVVYTSLDSRVQRSAESAVTKIWATFPKSMQSAQIGFVSIEPGTGLIRAMIGGNPEASFRGLNRAAQIRRQPGSSFKPFLYGNLLDQGFTLATPLENVPMVVDSGTVDEWKPLNDDDSVSDPVPMKYAVKKSLNLAAAYAITHLTTPDSVASFAKRCGISSPLRAVNSIALGTSDVSPLEMALSFGVFATEGTYAKPISILKIQDRYNHVFYRPTLDRVDSLVTKETCYLLSKALEGPIQGGTAYQVRQYYRGVACGKTGTTQNSVDAWFVGYNTKLATAIWVGYDNPKQKLHKSYGYGGMACAPIFGQFMASVAKANYGGYNTQFPRPFAVQDMELCEANGLLATAGCTKRAIYPVNTLKLPAVCRKHGKGEAISKVQEPEIIPEEEAVPDTGAVPVEEQGNY